MSLVVGKGVKADKVGKWVSQTVGELYPGEEVLLYAKCNNLRPMMDAFVVTNARVMGLLVGMKVKFTASLDEVSTTVPNPEGKTLMVRTADGGELLFKSVAPEDVALAATVLGQARAAGVPEVLRAAAEQQRKDALPLSAAEELERYGQQLNDDVFGAHSVRFYANGFVRVGLIMLGSRAKFERVLAVEASSDVTKKSGLGRGLAAVATGGVNLMGSNKRGDVYLTVRTEDGVHVLHEDPPTTSNLKRAKRLESIGRSVIRADLPTADGPAAVAGGATEVGEVPTERSIAERLRDLQALRDEGLVSEDEHQQQRARLLESL